MATQRPRVLGLQQRVEGRRKDGGAVPISLTVSRIESGGARIEYPRIPQCSTYLPMRSPSANNQQQLMVSLKTRNANVNVNCFSGEVCFLAVMRQAPPADAARALCDPSTGNILAATPALAELLGYPTPGDLSGVSLPAMLGVEEGSVAAADILSAAADAAAGGKLTAVAGGKPIRGGGDIDRAVFARDAAGRVTPLCAKFAVALPAEQRELRLPPSSAALVSVRLSRRATRTATDTRMPLPPAPSRLFALLFASVLRKPRELSLRITTSSDLAHTTP